MGRLKLGKHRLRTPAVCGAVIGKNLSEMRAGVAKAIKQGADLVELRVDGLRNQTGWEKLLRKDLPIIMTNRPKREGGGFKGSEDERISLLLDGVERRVPCIDIEFSTPEKLRDQVVSEARRAGVTVLMSHHNFSTTPSTKVLMGLAKELVSAGCDIAKIIPFAKNSGDALRTLDFAVQVLGEVKVPVVTFAMGDAGVLTRFITPIFGSPLVYAATGKRTAPAQPDIETTKRMLRELVPKEVKG